VTTPTHSEQAVINRILLLLDDLQFLNNANRSVVEKSSDTKYLLAKEQINQYYFKEEKKLFDQISEKISSIEKDAESYSNSQRVKNQNSAAFVEKEILEFLNELNYAWLPWSSESWKKFPNLNSNTPSAIRLGYIPDAPKIDGNYLPALIPFDSPKPLIFYTQDEAFRTCGEHIQCFVLRMQAILAKASLKLHILDPIGLGGNARLINPAHNTCCRKVFTIDTEIVNELKEIGKHISKLNDIQGTGSYESVEEYNANNKGHQLDYHCVVLYDFPNGYSHNAVEFIEKIIRAAPSLGVFIVFHFDRSHDVLSSWKWDSRIEKSCLQVRFKGSSLYGWHNGTFPSEIIMDTPPDSAIVDRIINASTELNSNLDKNDLPYDAILIPKNRWGDGVGKDFLSVPIGTSRTQSVVSFSLGEKANAHHAIIGGMTGSGKGNLLTVIITQLLSKYGADELSLYLCDFKQGQDLANYLFFQLPQVKAAVMESDPYSGISLLRWLVEEISRRSRKFFEGNGAKKIEEYIEYTGKTMPRIVVIMDEFPELLTDAHFGNEAIETIGKLVKQGRAYGVHMILVTQSFNDISPEIKQSVLGQMKLRICLQVIDPDHSEIILGPNNYKATELADPGQAIVKGQGQPNEVVRIALLADREQKAILSQLVEFYGESKSRILGKSLPQKLTDSAFIHQRFSPHNELEDTDRIMMPIGLSGVIKLGKNNELEGETILEFIRESGSNLLMIGPDMDQAFQIIQSMIVGLLGDSSRSNEVIIYSPKNILENFKTDLGSLANYVDLILDDLIFSNLENLLEKINERQTQINDDCQSVFVFLFNLRRLKKQLSLPIKGEEDGFSLTTTTYVDCLNEIVSDGPDVGIHTVVWSPSLRDVKRLRVSVDEFEKRIALSNLSNDETKDVLDLSVSSKIRPGKYSFYRETNWDDYYDRFEPYVLSSDDDLQQLLDR